LNGLGEAMLRIISLLTVVLISASIVCAQSNKTITSPPKPTPLNVKFCDLFRKPDFYDGKEIRFRATYDRAGGFLVSTFFTRDCKYDENNAIWVHFDRYSIKATSKPEIVQQLEEELSYEGSFVSSMTEMVVVGVFDKSKGVGYGRERRYRYLFTVRTIEKIWPTERI
jgi:hypothetical protein